MKTFNFGNLIDNVLVSGVEEINLYGELEPIKPNSAFCTIRVQKRIDALLATSGLEFFHDGYRYYVKTELGLIQAYNVCARNWINSDWGEQIPVIIGIGATLLPLPKVSVWKSCLRQHSTQEWFISKNSLSLLDRQYHIVKGSNPLKAILSPAQAGLNGILIQCSDKDTLIKEIAWHEKRLLEESKERQGIISALKAKL